MAKENKIGGGNLVEEFKKQHIITLETQLLLAHERLPNFDNSVLARQEEQIEKIKQEIKTLQEKDASAVLAEKVKADHSLKYWKDFDKLNFEQMNDKQIVETLDEEVIGNYITAERWQQKNYQRQIAEDSVTDAFACCLGKWRVLNSTQLKEVAYELANKYDHAVIEKVASNLKQHPTKNMKNLSKIADRLSKEMYKNTDKAFVKAYKRADRLNVAKIAVAFFGFVGGLGLGITGAVLGSVPFIVGGSALAGMMLGLNETVELDDRKFEEKVRHEQDAKHDKRKDKLEEKESSLLALCCDELMKEAEKEHAQTAIELDK